MRWTATLPFPDAERDYLFVSLYEGRDYPLERGRLRSSGGLDIAPGEYEDHFAEQHVPHSTALHSRLRDVGAYLLGPLSRYALNSATLSPLARDAAAGCGWSEAPRGMLWHRYRLAADGTIAEAKIVPPTSQNQPTIEADLRAVVSEHAELDDAALANRCEQAIRNHDPCISCATHFLDLEVERT